MGFADLLTIDVTSWPRAHVEQRGKRSKVWVTKPDGTVWLRKSINEKPYRPYENVIEAYVLELARQSGIESAVAFPCRWEDERGGQSGIVCRDFTDPAKEELFSAAQIFAREMEEGLDPKFAYSLDLVVQNQDLLGWFRVERPQLLKLLAFDAWVGNGDRHSENWSVITNVDRPIMSRPFRLAPMYDPAACLGSELVDASVSSLLNDRNRFEKYVANCPSGFGDGRSRILKMSEVVAGLVELPEWESNIRTWLLEFGEAFASLQKSLNEGAQWLPEPRQSLALKLLEARLQWLTAFTPSG